ncbi:WD40 repeat domain-containing protein [Chitinophaga agrisoli]|uniref:WD40 repeat domain-containing protein n=1 Tax=Chitinophaga agrisoli TaxID=2607653 RepID=A0A5B2VKK0_9BACT|nr:WD40 repeat domain-containing protein [Chitinophaga agrisoli]KAA2238822.1 WD40 repeat domain-containing protein [Chitinophaga agrisoli]
MRYLIIVLLWAPPFKVFSQSTKDCLLILQKANTAIEKRDFSLALTKLRAYKICDPEAAPEADRTILYVFDLIRAERDSAVEARNEALRQKKIAIDLGEREKKANRETKKQYEIAQNLLGDKYLAKARIALSNNDFNTAIVNIDSSLKIGRSREAELLISQVLNKIPPSLLDKMDAISDFSINPADENIVAYLGFVDNYRQEAKLKLLNRKQKSVAEVDGRFMAFAFSPDGKYLYAATQLKYELIKGANLDAKYEYEAGVIKFSNTLKPLDTIRIRSIAIKNQGGFLSVRDSSVYDARNYSRIDFTSDEKYMILSGYASESYMRSISNAMPHHLRTWIDLSSGKIMHDVGDEELSSFGHYRAITLMLNKEEIVRDGTDDVYIIDLKNNTRRKIGRHWSSINDMSVSPDRRQIACVGDDNRVTVLTREGDDWIVSSFTVSAQAYCEQVIFVDDNNIAVTRSDNLITLLSLKGDSGRNNIVLDGNTAWRNFGAQDFIGHTGKINCLSISPDRKWLVTSGEDNSARLWSLNESSNIALWGSKRGVVKAQFDRSGSLISASTDGTLLAYNLSESLRFNISSNPWRPRNEKAVPDVTWDEGGDLTRAVIRQELGLCRDIIFDKEKNILYSIDYGDSATVWEWKGRLRPIERIKRSALDSTEKLYFLDGDMKHFVEVVQSSRLILHGFSGKVDSSRTAFGRFSASGKYFVWYNLSDQKLVIWNTDNPNSPYQSYDFVGTAGPNMEELKFSDNEEAFAFPCYHDGPAIGIVSLKLAKSFLYIKDITGYSFDISPNGRSIVAAGRTGEVYHYSFVDNYERILGRHSRYVSSVAFSRDGEYVASGSRDRSVRIWPISNTVGDYSYLSFTNPVERVLFSPGGEQLLIAAGNGVHSLYFPGREIVNLFNSAVLAERTANAGIRNSRIANRTYNSPLGILPAKNAGTRLNYVSRVLGRNMDLSATRMKSLQDVICFKKNPYTEKLRAVFELSAFGSRALNCIDAIFEAHPSEVNFGTDELHDAICTELLSYTGRTTGRELIGSCQRVNNKWSKVAILQALSRPEFASKEVNTFLINNFNSEDNDIRIMSAVALPPSLLNTRAMEIMAEAVYEGHDLRDDCNEKMQLYGKNAVPYLIHCLQAKGGNYDDSPADLARKSLVAMPFDPSKIIIDSLNTERSSLEFKAELAGVLAERGRRSPEVLKLYLAIIKQAEDNKQLDQSLESIIYAIGSYGPSAAEAIPVLVDLMRNDKGTELYFPLSTALGNIGPKAVPAIFNALPNVGQKTKRYFYKALQSYPDSSKIVLPYLVEDLKHCNDFDCEELLELLAKFGNDAASALPVLFEKLKERNDYVIDDVVTAIGNINQQPIESAGAIVEVIERISNLPELEGYIASEAAIEQLKIKGVPVNVLMVVGDLDDMYREKSIFRNILYGRLGADIMTKYGDLILNACLSDAPHYCDKAYYFSDCCEALKKLSIYPEGIEERLIAVMGRVRCCFNLVNAIQPTIDFVRATRIAKGK